MEIDSVAKLVAEVAADQRLKVYCCEFKNTDEGLQLVIEVDKKGFVNLAEITAFSEVLSSRLDGLTELNSPYTLVCNSADPEREIPREEIGDYLGSYVEVKLSDGSSVIGDMSIGEDGKIELASFIKGRPKRRCLALEEIEKINLRVKI